MGTVGNVVIPTFFVLKRGLDVGKRQKMAMAISGTFFN
jgi:hypothetical protein